MRKLIAAISVVLLLFCTAAAEEFDVLRSLGIEISEDVQETVEAELEELSSYFGYEINDYRTIISILGYGTYDEETFRYIPYSDDVYAFDAEAWDIQYAYVDLLDAVERMSDGEIRVEKAQVRLRPSVFSAGVGKLPIYFLLNGEKCHYDAEFYYDWMDCTIIDYLNAQLEAQGSELRIWCWYDGGQGLVLLCGTEAWAQEFTQVTGILLWMDTNTSFAEVW